MSSSCHKRFSLLARRAAGFFCAMAMLGGMARHAAGEAMARPSLAVCADPTNLPYSNEAREGFENHIAALVAADMHADLRYTWNQERRSFFRKTLFAGACDVVISVPAGLPSALPKLAVTKPYFASSYVAVTRAADPPFGGFDDARLRGARIGLQLIGVDGANTPPAASLASRSLVDHITGFPMWAGAAISNPQGRIIDAVAEKTIDIAFVWGPFAGYFAKPYGGALNIVPVTADPRMASVRFGFPMAMGVRRDDIALRDRLQRALDRHKLEIDAILHDFAIPLSSQAAPSQVSSLPTR